jgi:hypothetical protein
LPLIVAFPGRKLNLAISYLDQCLAQQSQQQRERARDSKRARKTERSFLPEKVLRAVQKVSRVEVEGAAGELPRDRGQAE